MLSFTVFPLHFNDNNRHTAHTNMCIFVYFVYSVALESQICLYHVQ